MVAAADLSPAVERRGSSTLPLGTMEDNSSNWTPSRLIHQQLARNYATLSWLEKVKCRLGMHPWLIHRDYGWDSGTSMWCPNCNKECEW